MNDSVAENVVEEINNKSMHDGGGNNESFSRFQGSIEVNMFNSKFNNLNSNRRNTEKFLNNDEINFSKIHPNQEEDDFKKERISRSQERKATKIEKDKKVIEKKMSLEMNKTSSNNFVNKLGNASEKKNIKSVRSKKFLIPLDPNLYKVDMEEVKKKFIDTKYKKKILERLDSSKLMTEKTELMTNNSKMESRFIENKSEENNENGKMRESNVMSGINKNLFDNLNYLKQISEEKVNFDSNSNKDDEEKRLVEFKEDNKLVIDKKESIKESSQNQVSESLEKKEKLVQVEEKDKKGIEEPKTKNIPKSAKLKETKKFKKIIPPNYNSRFEKEIKIANSKVNLKTVSSTPTKKSNNSKLKVNVIDKKSPDKKSPGKDKIELSKNE
jgi:hypothetical protein